MIRPATWADRDALLPMAERFHAASPMADTLPFDPRAAAESIAVALTSPGSLVLVLDLGNGPCGCLAAQLLPWPFGNSLVAKEVLFWVDPGARGRWALAMLAEYEAWARRNGAALAGVSGFAGTGADALYRRAGFAPGETVLHKGLV